MKSNILKITKVSRRSKIIFGCISLLCVGVVLGYYLCAYLDSREIQSYELRAGSTKGFTNPLLECDMGQDTIGSKKVDFSKDLIDFVEELKTKQNLNTISVYYRDLNNGPVIGIGSSETFAPASLLKVPVLMSYLKWSEDKPSVLDEKIKYEKPIEVGYVQQFAPTVPLEVGKTYTARELLENMTKYSDNQALVLLYQRLPKTYQDDLYTLLGVDPNIITDAKSTLTIRQYSIFFRVLFNASFLSKANSEYALKLLSESTFEQGVRKGVPLKVTISHKFGERKTDNGLQQFHDCGIAYYPKHPYLVCVMTRGEDVSKLIDSIYKTSEFVYNKIDEQYSKK